MLIGDRIGGLVNGITNEDNAAGIIERTQQNYPALWRELLEAGFTEMGKFRVGSEETQSPASWNA